MTGRVSMRHIGECCCFTGHRPKFFTFGSNEDHPDCIGIKNFIRENCERLIVEKCVTHFISGGALGVDTWAMEEVLSLKGKYPRITLECALPYPEMPDRFHHKDRKRHDAIMAKCDVKTIVSPTYTGRTCLDKRNEYMVDHAGYLIAVWLGIMTGTGRTVEYAKKIGREVICHRPSHRCPK
ncbi:MAG: DUF1273 domain-containing protein [Planctomycetota bacterium]|nr:DUF1273 domain-containing protein [Planctomycetota bacterium]